MHIVISPRVGWRFAWRYRKQTLARAQRLWMTTRDRGNVKTSLEPMLPAFKASLLQRLLC
ncbi:MAG: hypothetical protein V9G29_04125 [Burkholderiaceae bacterium]